METEPRLNVVLSLHDGRVHPCDGVPLSTITQMIATYAAGGGMTIKGDNGPTSSYGPGDVTGMTIARTPWWAIPNSSGEA